MTLKAASIDVTFNVFKARASVGGIDLLRALSTQRRGDQRLRRIAGP